MPIGPERMAWLAWNSSPGGESDPIHPLLHLRAGAANIHLELYSQVVAPSRRSRLRGECFVEVVRIVRGHFAGAVVLHNRQSVVVLVVIGAGAVESQSDVIPGIGDESLTGNATRVSFQSA